MDFGLNSKLYKAQNPLATFPRNFPVLKCRCNGNLGNDTPQQTQRTFARANLLRTCCGETCVKDFGLNYKVGVIYVL